MKNILLMFFLSISVFANAQYFQTGQDPASLKWRQIITPNFQLIYPDYYEIQAQSLANIMEKVYNYKSNSISHKPLKISIILHTQNVRSNGLVAWAPKRSEFYTTPHQGIYAQDWLQQLALHEFRHVVQVDKIDAEIPRIIKLLLGEQGTALAFGANLPWWFIEGDAVITETAMSKYGRGRFPSFLMEHKAQIVEKGVYKYDKAYNSSLKDFVPNHYKLGYYLVGESRSRYGTQIWSKVLNKVGNKPLSLNPFNRALKNEIGKNKVELYNSVFDSLANVWIEDDKKYSLREVDQISRLNKVYTNYKYIHWLNNQQIVSYKTSLKEIPSFVLVDKDGKEKKLLNPGIIFDESVNYRNDWIVWAEQIPDIRWSHSGSSRINLYNINSTNQIKIRTEHKAFAPSISRELDKIIVVETDFSNNYFLSVYSIPYGKLLRRIQTEKNNYFFSPEWLNKNEVIAVVLSDEGKRLMKFNINSGDSEILSDKDMTDIKQLKVFGDKLYFMAAYSGKNSLYCMELQNKLIHRIYEPRFGAEYPAISPDGNHLAFSDYTADGFRILSISNYIDSITSIEQVKIAEYQLADKIAKQESGILDLSNTSINRKYDSKKYSKPANLFNFHSWAPLAVDVNSYDITPGVSVMSQNKLGTSETILGYDWVISEKVGKLFGRYTYKGWYPIFEIEVSNGKRASQFRYIQQTTNYLGHIIKEDTLLQKFKWNENNIELNTRIPLNFSSGKFSRLLQSEIKYDFTLYGHDESTPEDFFEGDFQSLTYRLYFQQLLKKSFQDVYPNFGVIVDLNYEYSPFGSTDFGDMVYVQSYLFMPGLMQNHGTRVFVGAHKKTGNDTFSFSDPSRYPRGWGRINSNEMLSLAFDYKLPLFYPEWSIGGLAYLKRVRASLYMDRAFITGDYYENNELAGKFTSDISSYGIELIGDLNFLRFYAPVEIGIRASYLPEVENIYFDFLFSIDFTSL